MEYYKSFPLLALLVPFMFSFAFPLIKSNKFIKSMSIFSSGISLALCALTLRYVSEYGAYKYKMGHFEAPLGIEFNVGMFECIVAVTFTLVTFVVLCHATSRIEGEISKNKIQIYYILVNIFYASLVGMVFTNDIFNAFVFIEVSTLAACGMVAAKGDGRNIIAAIKYLVYSSIGSGLILMGMAFLYSVTGNLNIEFINLELPKAWMQYRNVVSISLGLFVFGLGIKGGLFPLHVWLPDAYAFSNNSSSSLISGIGAKAVLILLIKVLYFMYGATIVEQTGIHKVLIILGVAGMIMGSVFAMFQKKVKRMLAYSSVAQMGYIFLGIGLGNVMGIAIAVFHAVGHAVTKAALFMSAGVIGDVTGKLNTDEFDAEVSKEPISLGVYTLGVFSMIGIPMLPGFAAKWNLSVASVESGNDFIVAAIILSSILNCIYYLPGVINGYFKKSEGMEVKTECFKSEKSKIDMIPLIIIAVTIIGAGIFSGEIMRVLCMELDNVI